MDKIIDLLLSSSLHEWVMGHRWIWPSLEVLHFFGLSLLIGSMLIVDLRMIGWFLNVSIAATHKLLPCAFIGFSISILTGILFFVGDPIRYILNIGFQIKMVLIILAGLNMVIFYWKISPKIAEWNPEDAPPLLARSVGAWSLLLWFGVLLAGRLIPYVGTG